MSKIKTSNDKNLSSIDTSISRVINNPIYPGNSSFTLLHYICANSLGAIIDFIFKMSDTIDIFYVEDNDGNTPLHILCKRMDYYNMDLFNYFIRHDPSLELENFTSCPSSTVILSMIQYLSDYINLSKKNKKNIAPVDSTSNIVVHNLCYRQMIRKTYRLKLSINDPNKMDWNALFNLKDSKMKNRTLLHHLCNGDRLNAIRFLIENGADVNVISRINHNEIIKPLDRLFSTITIEDTNSHISISMKYPSGFRKILRTKTGRLRDIDFYYNERQMLEETNNVAEYLVEHGADLNSNTDCDYSDIMYRLAKRKTENPKKRTLLKSISSVVKEVADGLMKYSCFPIGNYTPIDFIDNNITKKVKFIRISSITNENSDSKEKLIKSLI